MLFKDKHRKCVDIRNTLQEDGTSQHSLTFSKRDYLDYRDDKGVGVGPHIPKNSSKFWKN